MYQPPPLLPAAHKSCSLIADAAVTVIAPPASPHGVAKRRRTDDDDTPAPVLFFDDECTTDALTGDDLDTDASLGSMDLPWSTC